jgi:hypothetical protein
VTGRLVAARGLHPRAFGPQALEGVAGRVGDEARLLLGVAGRGRGHRLGLGLAQAPPGQGRLGRRQLLQAGRGLQRRRGPAPLVPVAWARKCAAERTPEARQTLDSSTRLVERVLTVEATGLELGDEGPQRRHRLPERCHLRHRGSPRATEPTDGEATPITAVEQTFDRQRRAIGSHP